MVKCKKCGLTIEYTKKGKHKKRRFPKCPICDFPLNECECGYSGDGI